MRLMRLAQLWRLLSIIPFGLGLMIATAGPAAAQSLHVSPSTVAAGGTVTVTGNCGHESAGEVLSNAFFHDMTHDFAGVPAVNFSTDAAGNFSAPASIPASRAPGSYEVTARCGGGNLGITVHLTVTHGTLPFTGSSSGALAIVGAVLVVLGAGLVYTQRG